MGNGVCWLRIFAGCIFFSHIFSCVLAPDSESSSTLFSSDTHSLYCSPTLNPPSFTPVYDITKIVQQKFRRKLVPTTPCGRIGESSYSSNILDLGTRRRWAVNSMPLLLYTWGKSAWYLSDRSLDGPQSWSGHCGEEKSLASTRDLIPAIQPITLCYINWAIPANIMQ
jgi:hypothetical protein